MSNCLANNQSIYDAKREKGNWMQMGFQEEKEWVPQGKTCSSGLFPSARGGFFRKFLHLSLMTLPSELC
jgi:hypothetical protein